MTFFLVILFFQDCITRHLTDQRERAVEWFNCSVTTSERHNGDYKNPLTAQLVSRRLSMPHFSLYFPLSKEPNRAQQVWVKRRRKTFSNQHYRPGTKDFTFIFSQQYLHPFQTQNHQGIWQKENRNKPCLFWRNKTTRSYQCIVWQWMSHFWGRIFKLFIGWEGRILCERLFSQYEISSWHVWLWMKEICRCVLSSLRYVTARPQCILG